MGCDNLKKAPLMVNITIMKKLKQNETKIEIIFLFNYSFLSFFFFFPNSFLCSYIKKCCYI